ncbi:MAG TPA: type II secretion system protein GspG [Myxococcota bacterium]|nr:type II secretion system protein GspG [Myxococcota bacterium]
MKNNSLFLNTVRSQRGLTLVEIMVVIAILGSLMAIVGFQVVGKLDEATCETTKISMGTADQGLQAYAAKHKGKFPSTSDGMEVAAKYFGTGEVPRDGWQNTFQYYSPGTTSGKDYELISLGKDSAEGGEGANADIKSWELSDETCDW